MPWINTNGSVSDGKPVRVRMADHTTLTGEEVTDAVLEDTGWSWVEPVIAPTPVASAITMRQTRLALLQAGLLATVDAAVAEQDEAARIEWEYATEVKRDHPLLVTMAASLGLSSETLDSLFNLGASL